MASNHGNGGDGQDGDQPRQSQSLQGLLRFCAEHTQAEDPTGPPAPMSEEKSDDHSSAPKSEDQPEKKPAEPSKDDSPGTWSSMETARCEQDKALGTLGLYRYKIPGDGNCMFRATASQLKLKQDEYHPKLRRKAVAWMKDHAEELLAGGLLDNLDEIEETAKDGMWPSQAAIVALANVLEVNIAIVQGGDKGTIDIQHVTPFDTPATKGCSEGIILAYLYTGHYDGIVSEPRMPNPEYKQWLLDCDEKVKMGESLARNIERYGSSYGRDKVAKEADDSMASSPYTERRAHRRTSPVDHRSPEFGEVRITTRDPTEDLTMRTRDLDLGSEPRSENVKPSMRIGGSTSSTHIPVFHERSDPAYRHSDVPSTRTDRYSQDRDRFSGATAHAKPSVHVIPIRQAQPSVSSRSTDYTTENTKYGAFHQDYVPAATSYATHHRTSRPDDRSYSHDAHQYSSSIPRSSSSDFRSTERVIPVLRDAYKPTTSNLAYSSLASAGFTPKPYTSPPSSRSRPGYIPPRHSMTGKDFDTRSSYSYAREITSFDDVDDYELLRDFRTRTAAEMQPSISTSKYHWK